MHVTKEQIKDCCQKPAVTVHLKKDYTFSVAVVSVIIFIILMHMCMCKMTACRKSKIKKLKNKIKTEAQTAE